MERVASQRRQRGVASSEEREDGDKGRGEGGGKEKNKKKRKSEVCMFVSMFSTVDSAQIFQKKQPACYTQLAYQFW